MECFSLRFRLSDLLISSDDANMVLQEDEYDELVDDNDIERFDGLLGLPVLFFLSFFLPVNLSNCIFQEKNAVLYLWLNVLYKFLCVLNGHRA